MPTRITIVTGVIITVMIMIIVIATGAGMAIKILIITDGGVPQSVIAIIGPIPTGTHISGITMTTKSSSALLQ
jgi:hypothetical protein